MNPAQAIAPPVSLRRHHPLRVEPAVFAVLLTLATVGINLAGSPASTESVEQKPVASQVAQAR